MEQPIDPSLDPLTFVNSLGDLGGFHNPFSLGLLGKFLFGIWAVMTIIFLYHWWKYSPSKFVAFRATTIYIIGSIIINIIITSALAIR